jgi:chemotaxis protein methyltransferase CheR
VLEWEAPSAEFVLEALESEPALLTRLVSLVRIGETYFFRHPEQLDVIARHVLPALAGAAAPGKRPTIDIWSAGCSTGEEAYSLAIIAAQAFRAGPTPAVHIAATDIDPDVLRIAAAGVYGRWSFRTPLGDLDPWFEGEARHRRVVPAVAGQVTFSRDNLTCDNAGPPPGLSGPPGLIVCRNVTMYLSEEARRRVAARFLRLLAPGGWLVVAPVELSSEVYQAFEPVVLDGLTFYRRPVRATTGLRPAAIVAASPIAESARNQRQGRSSTPGATTARSRAAAPLAAALPHVLTRSGTTGSKVRRPSEPHRLAAIRVLADEGRLDDAWRLATTAIRSRPNDRDGHHLLASIAEARDDLAEASVALRRAIYLDRADVVAHFRLGLLEWRLGHTRQATARLARAVRLVDGVADDTLLDPASDLTVARLRSTSAMLGHD